MGTQLTLDLKIETEAFEGPFDLLLHLVRVNEMDIFDINIAEITDQYLAHLARMERLNLEIAGEFLVMAATLLNIKSRTLLPANPHVEEDEGEEEGALMTTADLVRQLIEYRRFKEIAQVLGEREAAQMRVLYRSAPPPRPPGAEQPAIPPQTLDALLGAFARVIAAIGIEHRHEVFEDEANIEDALARVRAVIAERGACRLSELLRTCRTRTQAVVIVLALLELCRLGEIRLAQAVCFADVDITRRESRPEPQAISEPLTPAAAPPPSPVPLAREEAGGDLIEAAGESVDGEPGRD